MLELLVLILVMALVIALVRHLTPDLGNIALIICGVVLVIWLVRMFGILRW